MGSPAPGYDDSARGMASPGPARFNSPAHRARYDGERASDAAGGRGKRSRRLAPRRLPGEAGGGRRGAGESTRDDGPRDVKDD